ncbi:hypothetical protein HY488_00280 [Candidatus Woesearchaeota archaeon]|nr:hypothetical protein [Candidatus Woesearchaeota archaeon]
MRNTRRALFVLGSLLLLCLSSLSILATHHREELPEVSLEALAIKDKVLPGEWAEFDITLRNHKIMDDIFTIKVDEENTAWSVLTRPMPATNVVILGRHSKTFHFLFKDMGLRRDAKRPYGIIVTVESVRTDKVYAIQLPVYLLPGELDYSKLAPNITVTLSAPERIDPRNKYSFRVTLHNNNPRYYKDLTVLLNSTLVNQQSVIDLAGEQVKTVDFTVVFPENQPPTQDTLSFVLLHNGTALAAGEMPLVIVSYRIPFDQTVLITEQFLKRTEEYTVTNEENVLEQQVFRVPIPLLKGLIASATPPAQVETVDNVRYFSWMLTLQPGEKTYVTLTVNYRIYLYLVLLVGLVVFFYYMFKNPVVIIKQAEKIKTMEGGIAEMKIVLAVHNLSDKPFQCQLHERLPHMIEYLKREEHGLLPPDKVIRTKHGQVLRWLFDLEPHEERIIIYNLKTKLHVLGGLRLMPAVMRVKRDDMHITISSNELDVATE